MHAGKKSPTSMTEIKSKTDDRSNLIDFFLIHAKSKSLLTSFVSPSLAPLSSSLKLSTAVWMASKANITARYIIVSLSND